MVFSRYIHNTHETIRLHTLLFCHYHSVNRMVLVFRITIFQHVERVPIYMQQAVSPKDVLIVTGVSITKYSKGLWNCPFYRYLTKIYTFIIFCVAVRQDSEGGWIFTRFQPDSIAGFSGNRMVFYRCLSKYVHIP